MKKLIKNYLNDIKMTEGNIKRKNLASKITLITEFIKVILTLILINKISLNVSITIFLFSIIATFTSLFLLYNDDYKDFKKYIILDLSTLIFFLSNIVGGIIVESISYDADIKLIKKINKPMKKIKKLPYKLHHSKITYLYIFVSLIICYERLNINGILFIILSFIGITPFFIKDILLGLKEFKKDKKTYIFNILKVYIITLTVANLLSILCYFIIGDISTNEQMLETEPLWYLLITSIIHAPIVEELLFRGCLRKLIKNDTIFILVSGISFGLWHVIGYEQNILQYLYVLVYSTMGIGLSYIYTKTNNITTNITMHSLHNLLANITNLLT